jgi:hypothetical protein
MRDSAVRIRPTISLRSLIASVFPEPAAMPAEVASSIAQPCWTVMLRTVIDPPITTERAPSPRKYLWVRRTSRRAYNMHMSRMRESIGDINPFPAMAMFGSVVGIALLLSILIH